MTDNEFEDVRPKRNHHKSKNKAGADPFLRKRRANYKKHIEKVLEESDEDFEYEYDVDE